MVDVWIKQEDFFSRSIFVRIMLEMFEEDPDIVVLFPEDAHFHLNKSVNLQNLIYWSPNNPRELHVNPLFGC